jgi:hypothetical protein
MSCRWGWSGPRFQGATPPTTAAIEPDMRCILDGHWPSRRWSHTGPAAAHRRLASPVHRPHVQRGVLPFVSPQTNNMVRGHQLPPGHRAAPPCGVSPCQAISNLSMPLCSVMQHPCSDDNEGTIRRRVLPRRSCHLCSHCITTSADSCLHAGAPQRQCTAPPSNERYVRAAPSARLQLVACHQRKDAMCGTWQPAWMACITRPPPAKIKTITAVYPDVRAFKNTMGLVSKVDSRVASAVVWCAWFASTAAVSSTKRAKCP